MRRFAELYARLDETRKTSAKEAALVDYFASTPPCDAAWAMHFLLGRRGRRPVTATQLRTWAAEVSGQPLWLLEECYDAVGDLAETIALLVPGAANDGDLSLAQVIEQRCLALASMDDDRKRQTVLDTWKTCGPLERLLYTKFITGGFRVGVSKGLVGRALARIADLDPATIAHRLAGRWDPTPEAFARVLEREEGAGADPLRPYPFYLASPAPAAVEELGSAADYLAEWKWDGIRAQAVRRGGHHLLWSRGGEMVDSSFPEISTALGQLPDGTVLDGELLAWEGDQPLPFHLLQRRLGRQSVPAKLRAEVPVAFLAYDILELDGRDLRALPLEDRKAKLAAVLRGGPPELRSSDPFVPSTENLGWAELAQLREGSRARRVEGLMLKRKGSSYGAGRVRGDWWKWKVAPLTIDTVMIYAQRGHGRRASLYTDYTLGVWDGSELVPIAKAYSGLTDAEIRRVDNFVRRHIKERFGPVRVVAPELVFEIAFEGIQPSPRHKAGIALRFPRIARWREDKGPEDADTLEQVRELLDRQRDETESPS